MAQQLAESDGTARAPVAPLKIEDGSAVAAPPKRSKRPFVFGAIAVVALAGVGYFLYSRQFEETDDAEVDANISNIGPRVTGTVLRVSAAENQRVAANEVLAEVDTTDLAVALAQARASVASAEAQLQVEDPSVSITETSNTAALTNASTGIASAAAALAGAEGEVLQATARLTETEAQNRNAQLEMARGQKLFERGALARADLDTRETNAAAAAAAVEQARQAVTVARSRVAAQHAQVDSVRSHLVEVRRNAPREVQAKQAAVVSAQANLDLARALQHQAELNIEYAKIRTPVAGIVARKAVNLGDHVVPGQTLFAIAQSDSVWVTADFRETQLRRIRPGQTVSMHVDAAAADFTGTVDSLGGATGSRLSVLPPENASGNYVKVVQRLSVRIRLDPGQPGLDRLRAGMSVEPKVRVTD